MIKSQRAASIQAARRLLRLNSSTTLVQIRQAYRDLALESHPDRHPPEDLSQTTASVTHSLSRRTWSSASAGNRTRVNTGRGSLSSSERPE
ncbi:MAG: J domain-containing protein [Chloroflexi bacterium]|nr:J domain-containing protein [Chloroflexota bacterium]